MSLRTRWSEAVFAQPFRLPGMDAAYPPGAYAIETEDESLDLASHSGWRRVACRIHLKRPGLTEVVAFDWKDLEAALAKDRGA